MRSFIKSHRRDSSVGTNETPAEGSLSDGELTGDDDLSQLQTSPLRNHTPTSPNSKSKKLHRLFQRTKTSSPNLAQYSGFSPVSPNNRVNPTSIIGTRTHEWGTSTSDSHKNLNRISLNSSTSSIGLSGESFSSLPFKSEENDFIQLPLNTVLEIPDKSTIVSDASFSSQAEKKNIHRRAQIISTDELVLEENTAPSVPRVETNIFGGELAELKDSKKSPNEDFDEDDDRSEFSFEQDRTTGRNTSIRYYKSPTETPLTVPAAKEKGFYINDFVDDEFDEDLNYFDEYDDDFNDDEELFNRKYFSDDDDEKKIGPTEASKVKLAQSTPKKKAEDQPALGLALKPKRSLKYHQLPVNLDQEYQTNRYSWLSDDENGLRPLGTHDDNSYDSLLDEINNLPEDYEFEKQDQSKPPTSRSKSLNSSIKRSKGVAYEDKPQNTKFTTTNKTVTLFSYSNTNSNTKPDFSYSTPNSSFTTPDPNYLNDQFDLSPIYEGSFDGSP